MIDRDYLWSTRHLWYRFQVTVFWDPRIQVLVFPVIFRPSLVGSSCSEPYWYERPFHNRVRTFHRIVRSWFWCLIDKTVRNPTRWTLFCHQQRTRQLLIQRVLSKGQQYFWWSSWEFEFSRRFLDTWATRHCWCFDRLKAMGWVGKVWTFLRR